jgi:hypothetical protein
MSTEDPKFLVAPEIVLRLILDSVVELTRIKIAAVPHLSVEHFAPEVLSRLLRVYYDAGHSAGLYPP